MINVVDKTQKINSVNNQIHQTWQKNTFITYVTFSGLSLISMISMEISMNLVDFLFVGELKLTMEVILIMLFCGFFYTTSV